jgi:hypothetical protein
MIETYDIYIDKINRDKVYIIKQYHKNDKGEFSLTLIDSNGITKSCNIDLPQHMSIQNNKDNKDIVVYEIMDIPNETNKYKIIKGLYRYAVSLTLADEERLSRNMCFGDMAGKHFAERHIENPYIFNQDTWRDESICADVMRIDFFSEQAINNELHCAELNKDRRVGDLFTYIATGETATYNGGGRYAVTKYSYDEQGAGNCEGLIVKGHEKFRPFVKGKDFGGRKNNA